MCEWPTRSRLPTGQSKDLLSNVPGAAGGRRDTGPASCSPEHGAQGATLADPKQPGAAGCQWPMG